MDKTAGAHWVQLRGIYSLALTPLMLDLGRGIANPSSSIARCFDLAVATPEPDVRIEDRADRHGVHLVGPVRDAAALARVLADQIPATVRIPDPEAPTLVFSRGAKLYLDVVRSGVLPTLGDHHLLKAHGIDGVDQLEKDLGGNANAQELAIAGRHLWSDVVSEALRPGNPVRIVHAKPWKRDAIANGTVEEFTENQLIIRRRFRGGALYDSLNLPKLDGDWGRVEVIDGGTILRRTYYRAGGDLIGELYNIQTPAEIGPDGVWYVDLEVDVMRRAGEDVEIVDLDDLTRLAESGVTSVEVTDGARRIAEQLAQRLALGQNWRDLAAERLGLS